MKGIFLCRCQLSIDRQLALSARASCPRFKSAVLHQLLRTTAPAHLAISAELCGLAEDSCAVIAKFATSYYADFFPDCCSQVAVVAKPIFYPNPASDAE